ncbi:DNA-processing protein DprA [Pseudoruegeria sp. SK021]|uniref:DNA-processing protein DprA n=1 Tax=Pseudoruegeria sp. SK021 TaxID=1933035 RepID=UPI000A22470E|nr:DNA-processing protein DprA [Pseudoruegeria sp. SK021]OSP56522.1 DNA protecting protein DprA [Pseudoruegeria sp. SK021]
MTDTLFSTTTTPLTPPRSVEDRLSWLRLFRSRGVGVHTFFRLMQEHGSAETVLALLPDLAGKAGVSNYTPASRDSAETEMRAARHCGAHMVCFGDANYPNSLAEIPDPPPVFWAIGRIELLHRPMIALVGARNASSLGERMARRLAAELGAAGYVTVSGLARGIDAATHDASLSHGTIAVMGGGVDMVYPEETKTLFTQIGTLGLRISEQPMGLAPQARHFPRRNRIISGLACGLVVVEAAARSGSLITARNALDQGRDVCAVPGHPFDARASGCNMLIRDGATLVRSADDILEALSSIATKDAPAPRQPIPPDPAPPHSRPIRPRPKQSAQKSAIPRLHNDILARLGPSPVAEDQLIRDLALPAGQVAPALVDLELDGHVIRHAGGLISLASDGPSTGRH